MSFTDAVNLESNIQNSIGSNAVLLAATDQRQRQMVSVADLDASDLALWHKFASEQEVPSPFTSPSFVLNVAKFRETIKVVVVRDNGEAVGFFPIDSLGRTANAVGLNLVDFQSPAMRADVKLNLAKVARSANANLLGFDHMLHFDGLSPWTHRQYESPYLDLSQGYSPYLQGLRNRGSSVESQIRRKLRKLERDVGAIRFECNSGPSILKWILQRKSEQRQKTKTFDVLQYDWVVKTLEQLQTVNESSFAGVTCAMYAGDRLVAAHFSLRSASVLHYWFPAYDPDMSKYSPGVALLLKTAEAFTSNGITRLDLGRGGERYKRRLASGYTSVFRGAVDLNPARHSARKLLYRSMNWARESLYAEQLKVPFRAFKNASLRRSVGNRCSR